MATLRNVDDTRVPGCKREAAPLQKGEALLLRKQEFSRMRVSSVIVRRPAPPLPSLMPLKKGPRYEKFQPHTKVKRTCNEARTPVPDIQRLSAAGTVGSSVPLFLFLCWSISKKIPDIMSSCLPVLQYALKQSLCLLLFSEHGADGSPSDRPP